MAKKEGNGVPLKLIEGVIKFVEKYGYIKIICVSILMVFMSYASYLAYNPEVIFEKYREYEANKHTESFNYRMESSPKVEQLLTSLQLETGGARCFVIELHNGKSNASGLSFNYGALTYEDVRDSVPSVREDYIEFTVERYPILGKIYKMGYWEGSINDISKYDSRLAYKFISNGTEYLAIATLYGEDNEIGFLGVSYLKGDKYYKKDLSAILYHYASRIAPLLDGKNAGK